MGETASDRFQLHLLGGFSLRDPEGGAIDVPSEKARALLALLATAENGERKCSWLKEHLWSCASSQDNLSKELSSLRALLGSFDLDPLPKDAPPGVNHAFRKYFCRSIQVGSRPIQTGVG